MDTSKSAHVGVAQRAGGHRSVCRKRSGVQAPVVRGGKGIRLCGWWAAPHGTLPNQRTSAWLREMWAQECLQVGERWGGEGAMPTSVL